MNEAFHVEPEARNRSQRRLLEGLILLCVLCAGGMILYIPQDQVAFRFDCTAYVAQSINLYEGLGNTMDLNGESMPGYYPIGYPLLTAAAHWILGPDFRNGVWVNLLMALSMLAVIYFLARSMAGTAGGVLAVLLMLSSDSFRMMTGKIVSQPTSLLLLALVGFLFYKGWKPGTKGWWLRCLAGVLGGMLVIVRFSDVLVAPAIAAAAFIAAPVEGRSRLKTALPIWIGVAFAAMLVFIHNTVYYGAPTMTGYMVWGLKMDRDFSLSYILNPIIYQGDENPWPLLRSFLGLGVIYPWTVSLAALAGCIYVWFQRRARPALWRHFLLMASTTACLYIFLAFYFFRSPKYVLLTVPLIVVFAAGTVMLLAGRVQNRLGIRRPWLQAILLVAAAGQLVPCLGDAPLFRQAAPPEEELVINTLEAVDELIEDNAVVVSGLNPIGVEYVVIRGTQRQILFLTTRQDDYLIRQRVRQLGEETITAGGVERFIRRHLEAGVPVYTLLGQPDEAMDLPLITEVLHHLKETLAVYKTGHEALKQLKVRKRPPVPPKKKLDNK